MSLPQYRHPLSTLREYVRRHHVVPRTRVGVTVFSFLFQVGVCIHGRLTTTPTGTHSRKSVSSFLFRRQSFPTFVRPHTHGETTS